MLREDGRGQALITGRLCALTDTMEGFVHGLLTLPLRHGECVAHVVDTAPQGDRL
jgi:hypothetical protein